MIRRVFGFGLLFLAALSGSQAESAAIPLEKGLVLVYEGYDPGGGDRGQGYLERLVTVTDTQADQVVQQIQFNDHVGNQVQARTTVIERITRREDLAGAHRIINMFLAEDPPLLPGYVFFRSSAAQLSELTGSGTTHLVLGDQPPDTHAGFFNMGIRKYYRGDLKVVEPHAVIQVLVNGSPIALDAIHARGTLSVAGLTTTQDFWIALDAGNPIILRLEGAAGNYIQLVKADMLSDTTQSTVAAEISQGLEGKDCRATMTGIYFGTGSDVLLPASEPALRQVGDVLTHHAAWKVMIEGHTDNVGTDDYNNDLSRRRAESVKQALVERYAVSAQQLSTTGYGETRPVASNDTPVGRAANRRVELSRSCG